MKKILLLSDSLGLPRLTPEAVLADETWTYRLAALRPQHRYYYHCIGGLTTEAAVQHLGGVLGAYRPDVLIVQLGIVDCYPRALTRQEVSVVSRLPALGPMVHRYVRRNYSSIVARRRIAYVALEDFIRHSTTLRAHFAEAALLAVPIAPPNEAYQRKNPLVKTQVERYNQAIAAVYGDGYLGSLYAGADMAKLFLSDNYHLSAYGHELVAARLADHPLLQSQP